jgi:hypothetical protein
MKSETAIAVNLLDAVTRSRKTVRAFMPDSRTEATADGSR